MERGAVAGTQRAIGGGLALRQGGDHRMRVSDLRCSLIAGLAAAGLITGACGDHGTGTGPGGSSLQLLYGDGATDTVLSVPAQALVVEVRGENGVPVPGTVVRFQSLPIDSAHPFAPGVFVAAVTSTYFETFVADSTDSRGRSSVLIELGTSSGAAKLLVSVPEFGLQDTARFTVLPGNAARESGGVLQSEFRDGYEQFRRTGARAELDQDRRPSAAVRRVRDESLEVRARDRCDEHPRSEERRVGKECRSRWSPYH